MPNAFGETTITLTANVLSEGETSVENDEIVLDDNSSFDLSERVTTVSETIEAIGETVIELTQEITFVSNEVDEPITMRNTDLPTILVEIPDQTTLSAPANWDNTILPPTEIATSGTVPSGFVTPTSSIQIGSVDVVLIFDSPVTVTLIGITGQTAYKLTGETTWNLISTCSGTFDNPIEPGFPNECAISNGVDTKIVTYHFTEFAGLGTVSSSTGSPQTTPSPSGGSGKTGTGPSGGKGTGFGGIIPKTKSTSSSDEVFPSGLNKKLYNGG